MIALVPLVCLLIVVSDMDAAAIKSMSCPGTTASSNCINAECSMTCADGTKKELTCPPGQTGINCRHFWKTKESGSACLFPFM